MSNPAVPPRSLAEALRARDDDSLAALLRARPDLITPVPTDLTQLATRAGTRASVVRALERLDLFALRTAEALAVAADPAPYGELERLLTGDAGDPAVSAALPRALGTLREQALVWGDDDRLRLVRTARELLAPSPQHPSPTGLGPTVQEATAGMSPGRIQDIVTAAGLGSTHDAVSAVASLTALFTDRKRMSALLAGLPEESREVLSRLVWGPPYGQVTADPASHLRRLLDLGLLVRDGVVQGGRGGSAEAGRQPLRVALAVGRHLLGHDPVVAVGLPPQPHHLRHLGPGALHQASRAHPVLRAHRADPSPHETVPLDEVHGPRPAEPPRALRLPDPAPAHLLHEPRLDRGAHLVPQPPFDLDRPHGPDTARHEDRHRPDTRSPDSYGSHPELLTAGAHHAGSACSDRWKVLLVAPPLPRRGESPAHLLGEAASHREEFAAAEEGVDGAAGVPVPGGVLPF